MHEPIEPLLRSRVRRLLTVVVALIVYGSLYPFSFQRVPTPVLAWIWDPGLPGIRDAAINLAVYFPVGFLACYLAPRSTRIRILAATLFSAALSTTLECLQSFDQGRVSSLLDLALNTLGGLVGACTAALLPVLITAPLAVVLLAILARTYPFFPNSHPNLAPFQLPDALFAAVDWLAVRAALAVYLNRPNVTRPLALLLLVILLRPFILDQGTSLSEIAGALLALAITNLRPRRLAPIMLLAVIVRELMPFHFSPTPQPFHWIPFETFLAGPPAGAVVFLTKLSLYATALWLLDPHATQIAKRGAALALLIFLLEWTQRYLPGRTPDISDPLIVLIAACILSTLRRTTPDSP